MSTKFDGQMHHVHIEMIAGTLITLSTARRLSAYIVFDRLSDEYNF